MHARDHRGTHVNIEDFIKKEIRGYACAKPVLHSYNVEGKWLAAKLTQAMFCHKQPRDEPTEKTIRKPAGIFSGNRQKSEREREEKISNKWEDTITPV